MLLVSIWHILTKGEADIHAVPEKEARRMMQHVMDLGKKNREEGMTPARQQYAVRQYHSQV
jgi:CBS domain containing-hemolysin-like protein